MSAQPPTPAAAAAGEDHRFYLPDLCEARAVLAVPSLLLQPLLENAIGHGIEPLPEGGTVTIHGRADDETVEIEASNPVPAQRRPARSGHQIALDNIRQRLEFGYPGRSSVEVDDAGDTYRVRLRFPLVLGETSGPP